MTPVRKFRTHEEAHRAHWLEPGDPRIPERLRQVLYMNARLYPILRPIGVFKFRTIEDANAFRERWSRG
jgi:hypothetical protein